MLIRISELQQQLQYANSPNEKISILYEIGWWYAYRESADNLQTCLDDMQVLLDLLSEQSVHIIIHRILRAFYESITVNFVTALKSTIELQKQDIASLPVVWQWRFYYLVGVVHTRLGNSNDAMQAYRQLHTIAVENNDDFGEHLGLLSIGVVYGYLGDYMMASKYFMRSKAIGDHTGDRTIQFSANVNLASAYLSDKQYDKAVVLLHQAMRIAIETGDNLFRFFAASFIAQLQIATEQYDNADETITDILAIMSDSSETHHARNILLSQRARMLASQGQYQRVVDILLPIIETELNINNDTYVVPAMQNLAEAYEQLGDFENAFYWQKRYTTYYKRLHDEQNIEKIQTLEILHHTRETEAQLAHQRQIAEQAMERAKQTQQYFEELNQIKRDFIDSATHDLKNPLTGIRLNTSMLRRKIPTEFHTHLNRIETDTERMNALIADMLDVAKLETGTAITLQRHSMIDLIETVRASEMIKASARHITITTNYLTNSLVFYFDSDYMFRCLVNLVSNAVKYSPDHTMITITAQAIDEIVRITVTDEGVGIPEDELPKIFERFYRVSNEVTTQVEGTGLGLAFVKSIVEQHHGKITVDSNLGQGTTVTIELPFRLDYTPSVPVS